MIRRLAFFLVMVAWVPAVWAVSLTVAVSVPPQGYFVQQIAGERAQVEVLIPPGRSPETYAPTPRQMVALNEAAIYVAVGSPDFVFERLHLQRLRRQNPHMQVVNMAQGISFLPSADPAEGETDRHLWLAPDTVRIAARNIADALIRVDPEAAPDYRRRLAAFEGRIDHLDGQLHALLDPLKHRSFVVNHPAWGYFARQYGLRQIAIQTGGKEPGPADLTRLVGRLKALHARVIFVQQGFSQKGADIIAREVGARVVPMDPLAADWPDNLLRMGRALNEALQ